jgi:hypothetical protein
MSKLKRKKKDIELAVRKGIANFPLGVHRSLFFGSGGEFQTVRQWQPGDRRPSIPASARLGKLMFKVFEEPKAINVWLIVDGSSSMSFGSKQKRIDAVAAICLLFGFSIDSVGDRLAVLIFGFDEIIFLELGGGCDNAFSAMDILFRNERKRISLLSEALSLVASRQPTNSLVIIISDFYFPLSDVAKNYLRRISGLQNTTLLSLIVGDGQEDDLPQAPLMAEILDAENGSHLPIDLRSVRTEANLLAGDLLSVGSHVLSLNVSSNYFKYLNRFFSSLPLRN